MIFSVSNEDIYINSIDVTTANIGVLRPCEICYIDEGEIFHYNNMAICGVCCNELLHKRSIGV
jgi:hypothetical protein